MPPDSCLTRLRVPVGLAEAWARGGLRLYLYQHSFVVGLGRGGVCEGGAGSLGVAELHSSDDDPLGLEAI